MNRWNADERFISSPALDATCLTVASTRAGMRRAARAERSTRRRRDHARHRRAFSPRSTPTATGSTNSKPTRRFPPNTCCWSTTSAKRRTSNSKQKIARYLRRIQLRRRRLAALHRRRARRQRERQGVLRAEDDRRLGRRRAHGPRARGDSRRTAARKR